MPRGYPNNPRPKVKIETKDIGTDSPIERDLSSTKTEDDLAQISVVTGEGVDSPNMSSRIKELAFNEDKLDIMIGETSDPNAENPVASGVNGVIKHFTRGQIYKAVPRKFIASLIKKEVRVTTKNYLDDDGLNQTKTVHTPSIKTNVQIIHDPAGALGSHWFEWMCQQAH